MKNENKTVKNTQKNSGGNKQVKMMARVLAVVISVAIMVPFVSCVARNEQTLAILFTGNICGNVEKSDNSIGLPALKTAYQNLNSSVSDAMAVDYGNFLYGNKVVDFDKGGLAASLYAMVPYDAVGVAGTDFSYGESRLKELAKENKKISFISSNLYKNDSPVMNSYAIKKLGSLKIGIIAVDIIPDSTSAYSKYTQSLQFKAASDTVKKLTSEINNKCNMIVVLSQLTDSDNERLANDVPGIDIIIGGSDTSAAGSKIIGNTLIARADLNFSSYGVISIQAQGRNVISKSCDIIGKDKMSNLAEDAKMLKAIESKTKEYNDGQAIALANATVKLDADSDKSINSETNFGDLVADCIRKKTGADLAVIDTKAIVKSIDPGEIKYSNLAEAILGDYAIVTSKVKGAVIQEMMQNILDSYGQINAGIFQISGFEVTADVSKPQGSRLVSITVNGSPIELDKEYVLGTTDYVLAGAEGIGVLALQKVSETYGSLMQNLSEYVKELKTISNQVDGRLKIENAK